MDGFEVLLWIKIFYDWIRNTFELQYMLTYIPVE